MIKLELQNYCQDGCMAFKPVEKHVEPLMMVITCENRTHCAYLVNYLRKHALKGEEVNEEE